MGNPGDVKPIGKGVSELRVDYGAGYRVYFVQRGDTLIGNRSYPPLPLNQKSRLPGISGGGVNDYVNC